MLIVAYLRRHRRCGGCEDCRDAVTYTADPYTFNPLGCTACGGDKPPCHWVAKFPCPVKCGITTIASETLNLQPICPFENFCQFTEVSGAYGTAECTSSGGRVAVSSPKWILDLGVSPVTLTYDFGGNTIVYTAIDTWDCTGENTMELTSYPPYAACGPLPDQICVVPVNPTPFISDGEKCSPKISEDYQTGTEYDSEADRLACCDPYCEDMGAVVYMHSPPFGFGTNGWTISGPAVLAGSPAGLNSPSGPSRYLEVHSGGPPFPPFAGGCRVVIYCSGGTWYADFYDSTRAAPTTWNFVATVTIDTTCCPLCGCSGQVSLPGPDPGAWVACVCIGGCVYSQDHCIDCIGNCHYTSAVDGSTPTGFKWVYASTTCDGPCEVCPTVDAAFYADHGYPNLITDTLDVACAHT